MATAQGQDIIECSLCQDPVEFYCNLCHKELCSNCVLIHMKDKTKKHQVVEFSNKKCSLVFPECSSHENKCETYCCDCEIPTCIECVTDSHKGHVFSDLEKFIEDRKKQISSDIEEQKSICERYQTLKEAIVPHENEFDTAIRKISQREEDVVRTVREAAAKMKSDVEERKTKVMSRNNENMKRILDSEHQLQQAIKKCEETLQSRFAIDLINYCSISKKNQEDPCFFEKVSPVFLSGISDEKQMLEMIGSVSYKDDTNKGIRMHHVSSGIPSAILKIIQSPYVPLWRLQSGNNGKIWTSGDDQTIREIDKNGQIINTIQNAQKPGIFSINTNGDVLFSACHPSGTIYLCTEGRFKRYFSLRDWFATGICFSFHETVLVSMRSAGEKQSRVTRFSNQAEIERIQYDAQGIPLFSTNNMNVLPLTENRNGDICVADFAGEIVVVVNAYGKFKFKYDGKVTSKSKYREFSPLFIAADDNQRILIGDCLNDIVHIIDRDGNFVRYIEHPCTGGLGIDSDHNLVVGNKENGLISIIRY